MPGDTTHRSGVLHTFAAIGTRAAATTLRPFSGVVDSAVDAGRTLERRAVERVLDSDELEYVLLTALGSERLQAALRAVLDSDGAARLVDSFFDSGLFDRFIERLAASDALWWLIDEIAQSPSVTAAISQQGLGFADQVGGEMRVRSRRADAALERAARRLVRRHQRAPEAPPDAGPS